MTHMSLFSGIGGIDIAAEWAGFNTICMVEKDEFCQRVLRKNFPDVPIFGDIKEFDGTPYREQVTLLSAGWPCQPFSQSGQKKASDDERNLWPDTVRVLEQVKPAWFLGENVSGLFAAESGFFFRRLLDDLAALGYSVGWANYGAYHIGATHKRKRLFILAHAAREPRLQTGEAFGPERKSKSPREDASRRHWQPIRGGDWKQWEVNPTVVSQPRVRRNVNGISDRVDRITSLGNAVVPQQVYPLIMAIRNAIENDSK